MPKCLAIQKVGGCEMRGFGPMPNSSQDADAAVNLLTGSGAQSFWART